MATTRGRSITWRTLWRGLVGLFGLDTCPTPPRRESASDRAKREGLAQMLPRGLDGPSPPHPRGQ